MEAACVEEVGSPHGQSTCVCSCVALCICRMAGRCRTAGRRRGEMPPGRGRVEGGARAVSVFINSRSVMRETVSLIRRRVTHIYTVMSPGFSGGRRLPRGARRRIPPRRKLIFSEKLRFTRDIGYLAVQRI